MKLLYSSLFIVSTTLSVTSAAIIDKTKSLDDDVATYNSPPVVKKAADAADTDTDNAKNLRGLKGNPWEGGNPHVTVIAVLNPDKNGNGVAQKCAALSSKAAGSSVKKVIKTVLEACVIQLPKAAMAALKNNPDIKYVEEDQTAYASAPSWGIDRINQCTLPLDDIVTPKVDAAGVRVYVLDTGLNHNHADFVGMVGPESCWNDQINENSFPNTADGHGHGTHVSSTTVGLTYGVATGAELCPVKVLSSGGSGSGAGVMAGIDFVAENCNDPATNPDGKRCVANMSLGGGFLQAENDAVNAAVASGVVFVVAAGNDAGDACGYSPASAADAITVGSTTITDSMSGFSNYGSCMDIWAPGSNIKAAWFGSNTATNTISGTSMASPHVAGVAAGILGGDPSLTPAQVIQKIQDDAHDMNFIDGGGFDVELANTEGGCKTPTVSPAPTMAPPPSMAPTACGSGRSYVTVDITTDNYPAETSWTLAGQGVNKSGGGFTAQNTLYSDSVCVPDQEYTFTISDTYGDGICCQYGSGSYTVTAGGSVLAEGESFTTAESTTFTVGGGTENSPEPTPTPPTPPTPPACKHNKESCTPFSDGSNDCCSGNCKRGSCKGGR